ncbi:hypothetical protein J6590_052367 [Homalodisca vitripennis]|nr:hypothetical protein J6590_052367 [Homalodisca vitripennis]
MVMTVIFMLRKSSLDLIRARVGRAKDEDGLKRKGSGVAPNWGISVTDNVWGKCLGTCAPPTTSRIICSKFSKLLECRKGKELYDVFRNWTILGSSSRQAGTRNCGRDQLFSDVIRAKQLICVPQTNKAMEAMPPMSAESMGSTRTPHASPGLSINKPPGYGHEPRVGLVSQSLEDQ